MPQQTPLRDAPADALIKRFEHTREVTLLLCQPLNIEDYNLQAMADVSPPKWHLAHTTWFYETFILKAWRNNYQPFNHHYDALFNSYYHGIGPQFSRPERGLLSRPTLAEILNYRNVIEEQIVHLLATQLDDTELHKLVELGINHEQQHQELLLTDIKYSFSHNPLFPAYQSIAAVSKEAAPRPLRMLSFKGQEQIIGHAEVGFHFDNETPMHPVLVQPFKLANRLISNAEFVQFIEDGGYQQPLLWLSEGWQHIQQSGARAPLYWHRHDDEWHVFSLNGLRRLNPGAPVTHVNYFEADAFARWAQKRLPTEVEWELAAKSVIPASGRMLEQSIACKCFCPAPPDPQQQLAQLFGDCWEWTASAYGPYSGYKPLAGAVGEYNGKFMCGQYVLRGGSCVTPGSHIRATYRNFFYPRDQWQFSGIRLAE